VPVRAAKPVDLTPSQLVFIAALREILPTLRHQSDKRIAERIGYQKLQDATDDLIGFIDSSVDGTLTQNEYFALACQVLRCLSSYLTTAMQMPATINTIPNQMGLLEWAVNTSYPGYAQSHLLKYIIRPRG
jgi:hypothetical protein